MIVGYVKGLLVMLIPLRINSSVLLSDTFSSSFWFSRKAKPKQHHSKSMGSQNRSKHKLIVHYQPDTNEPVKSVKSDLKTVFNI